MREYDFSILFVCRIRQFLIHFKIRKAYYNRDLKNIFSLTKTFILLISIFFAHGEKKKTKKAHGKS